MSNNVFCRDCKYVSFKTPAGGICKFDGIADYCRFVKSVKVVDSPFSRERHQQYAKPEEDNKNNSCPYFEMRGLLSSLWHDFDKLCDIDYQGGGW